MRRIWDLWVREVGLIGRLVVLVAVRTAVTERWPRALFSAVLVHQLVLRRAASVVLTLRTGERAPDAVTALWKDGHLPRLEPLSQDETAMLVETRLGGRVDSVAARRLWSVTEGNALYLWQLVDGELESSRLQQVAGVWRWSGELALSPGLMELVSARIGAGRGGRRWQFRDAAAAGQRTGLVWPMTGEARLSRR